MRVVLVVLIVLAALPARAQEMNYQTFLVGERALGMGGAYTGLADDPSAAYYNPAGLAQIASSTLSGSLSVNAFNRYRVEDGYGSPVGTADLVHDGTPTVPLFVGLVKKFGPRDDDRVRRHAVALSTIHPQSASRRFAVTLVDDATGVHTSLRVTHSDRMRWYGPSYAYRVSPSFAVGVSAFLATRSMRHEEDEVIVTLGTREPDGFYRNSTLSVRESLVEADMTGVVLRVGALWDANEHWRLGIMVQPPGIRISESSRVRERRSYADLLATDPIATFFYSDQDGLDSESPVPLEVRVGVSYAPSESLVATLDASVYAPVGSDNDLVQQLGQPAPEPTTLDTPQPGILAVTDYRRELTFNASIGMEAILADAVPIRAGFFTDFSSAPRIDGPTDRYAPARVNGYGASLSVGIRADGYDLAIGAAGLLGFGRGLRLNPDPGGPTPETFLPTDVETRAVYFFLSGAKRAASRLARNVYDEYLRPE